MARRRDDRPRVLGPWWSEERQRWRASVFKPRRDARGHQRSDRWFEDEEEARDWVAETARALERLTGRTFSGALDEYQVQLKMQGNKEDGVKETIRRLRAFFEPVLTLQLGRLTETRAAELYAELNDDGDVVGGFAARMYTVGSEKKGTLRQKPVSVDFHRHTLALAKSFLRWCVKPKGWLKESPLDLVEGIGRRRAGKPQLTVDEARRWWPKAIELAEAGDEAALACALALACARRSGDVRNRLVRDVDAGATKLRVEEGKTKASDWSSEIPLELQEVMAELVEGRAALEPLFKADDGGFRSSGWLRKGAARIAREAGTPYVCPHGLKGTAATLGVIVAGGLSQQVVSFLSHESGTTSSKHYVAQGAIEQQQQAQLLTVLQGGKR